MQFVHFDLSGSLLVGAIAVASTLLCWNTADSKELPRVLDPHWQIELIASEPGLVTPVGCCFDNAGRLLVIECHTHFPPDNYDGPKVDRIWMFDDADGNGVVDRKRLFYEGGVATMGVVNLGGGWIGVATRSEVVRIRDTDNDDVADDRELLLTLKTEEVYPHDGLAGLVVGPNEMLYVGQGENLGKPYELIATDGSKQVGGGEGGNIFRCTLDGKNLERIATGFWNPFGLCFDPAGRLWTVGNDPDAMPPCRLLHVVPGGDYGFQFRFGRAGIHPLQSWNGEFPGTLPMAAGTGEATCAVVPHGEHLWVTSWGDNRVERYKLAASGATMTGETEVVVQGDSNFRPVGMTVAPDDSLYFTDWVDRSYPVHGKGRLWRLSRKADAPAIVASLPELSENENVAKSLVHSDRITHEQRLNALDIDNPFLFQAAATGLVNKNQLQDVKLNQVTSNDRRLGVIAAWRWQELTKPASVTREQRAELIDWGLSQDSDKVLLASMRWASERDCKEFLPTIRNLLKRPELSSRTFSAAIASIAYLETGSAARGKRDPAIEKLVVEFVGDTKRSDKLRALAVRMIPVESKQPSDALLGKWASETVDRELAIELLQLLTARQSETAATELAKIASDTNQPEQNRADAVAGLARNASRHAAAIQKLASPKNPQAVRTEVRRIARRAYQLQNDDRPPREDIDAWVKLVESGGDADAGRRVFFRTTCANCHTHSGRGAKTGPDLTTLSGQMTTHRFLESILEPSKEIGPLYVPWRIETVDGRTLTGLKLDKPGAGSNRRFQGGDGNYFEVALGDIEEQYPVEQSIMPAGLETLLTIDELRDLAAFLLKEK